jgi:RimJ/RimL family protein N-acetyltransferase
LRPVHVPELECARVRLRPWRNTDAMDFMAILADAEVMRYFGSGLAYRFKRAVAGLAARVSDLEARRAISGLQRHWAVHGFGEWAVEERDTRELLGKVGLVHHPDWPLGDVRVEIGWMLARPAWGRGLATEAATAALDDAFERAGLDGVISVARRDNVRSERVMQKLGMRREGATRWRGSDMIWYSLDRGTWLAARKREAAAARG